MIVNRLRVTVKQGRMEELVELIKEWRKQGGYNVRLYQSHLGTRDQIAYEFEFEDYAAYDKFWTEWYALPDTPAYLEKSNDMTNAGGTNELWWLIEQIATNANLLEDVYARFTNKILGRFPGTDGVKKDAYLTAYYASFLWCPTLLRIKF